MAIQGVDPHGSASIALTNAAAPVTDANQNAAQKLAEARAEARTGINDGDENTGASVDKLA